MRLWILSDLHFEFEVVELPRVECDVVILAGDIACKEGGLSWILKTLPEVPILYAMGNHEYYGHKYPRLLDKLRERAQGTHVHIMEDNSVSIDGIHFFGCTLWTDMALHGDWVRGAAAAGIEMNDYKKIRDSRWHYAKIKPKDTRLIHFRSVEQIRGFLAQHEPQNCVVISHHAPSILSLPLRRRHELISCAYASHLDELIAERGPRMWIHGHVHHSNDYRIGNCRVLANPRAYPEKPNPDFVPDLVVEIEPVRELE